MLFALSGCGKASLESGTYTSDNSVLGTGAFNYCEVNLSFARGDLSVAGVFNDSVNYSYLFNSYNNASGFNSYYFMTADKEGNVIVTGDLELPFSIKDGKLVYSDAVSTFSSDILPLYDYANITYSGFSFDENGGLSGYCELYGFYNDDKDSVNLHNFSIKWDTAGRCVSVDVCDEYEYSFFEHSDTVYDTEGTIYKLNSTGISVFDDELNYVSEYFDFFNSGIASQGFEVVSVIDNDSFSGIYRDLDGEWHLACFNRNQTKNSDSKAIVLACSGLNNELKAYIDEFNNQKNGFRITVDDYSDKNFDGDSEEAWSLLKTDIIKGYSPDLVLNTTGFDLQFCTLMGSQNRFSDLNDVIKKDKSLNTISFSDIAISLFYYDSSVYSVVPSYTYRTAIGSTDFYGQDQMWDENSLMSVYKPMAESKVLFFGDTKISFLERILEYGGYSYVNYSDKTADFDSEGFKQYLELASMLPEDEDQAIEKQYSEENYGQALLFDINSYSLGDMNLEYTFSSKGAYSDLGIPVGSNAGSGVYVPTMSFMIMSGNAYTNECWDFIKQFLSPDYQNNLPFSIPVIKSAYEEWLEDTVPRNNNMLMFEYEKNGETYRIYAPGEEEKGYIVQHLNSCKRIQFSDYNVKVIVLNYAQQYFEGKISLDEAASSIDREVEAYLAS